MFSANLCGVSMDAKYGLYLPEYSIPAAEVQMDYKEIPFRDGAIDKTDIDGVVRYKDREWELEFQKTGPDVSAYDLPSVTSVVSNDLHGRNGEIIFDDDSSWIWEGRVFVGEARCEDNGLIIVSIKLITRPYKRKVIGISKSVVLSGTSQVISLVNGRKPIIPTLYVSDSATLAFTIKGSSYTSTLGEGTWTVTDLVLFEGITDVSVTGSGTLIIEYPELSL